MGPGRVMVTAPLGVPGDAWADVVARLAGAALVGEGAYRETAAHVRTGRSPGCSATPASPRRCSPRRRPHRTAPRLAGSAPAHRHRRPRHLAHYPVAHLSVTWRTALIGPLALGAGTGYGLGLLVPVPD